VAELIGSDADHAEAAVATVDLLQVITGYERVVIIDAFMDADRAPGTTVRATPDDLPDGFGYRSFHTLPFKEMLRLGREIELPLPAEIVIHGIVVEDASTFSEEFTPLVAEAWPEWAATIAAEESSG
jgi:hydrogenase maturation protease